MEDFFVFCRYKNDMESYYLVIDIDNDANKGASNAR